MPNVWTDIHTNSARAERLSCRPRSEKLGGMVRLPYRVLEDVGANPECIPEGALVLHLQGAGPVGLKEPLVRVQPYRIGTLEIKHLLT